MLITMPRLTNPFGISVGLSGHTLDIVVPVTAVAMEAGITEKRLTLSRSVPGTDSAFSLDPHVFRAMVDALRTAEEAHSQISYKV
jgi:N-acetylneuraminate synthase